ncbi:RNA polymerase sigma factor [Xanthobacteraceae bacterium A53D]
MSTDGLRALFLAERLSLTRFFRRTTGSAARAEDLAQETFLRLAATDIGSLASPAAYLRRISTNLATDVRRADGRSRLSSAEIDELMHVPDPAADPEAQLIAKDRIESVLAALATLPERRRQILLASRLEGLPHRELAETWGVSTRTIEIEIRKALEHCARALID